MSVPEVRVSFDDCELSRDRWWLERESFRNHIWCYLSDVKVSFRFAGVVSDAGEPPMPTESALIEVEIGRTLKDQITRQELPDSYLGHLRRNYESRLLAGEIAFGRTSRDLGHIPSDRFRTREEVAQFTQGDGVRVTATESVIGDFLDRERRAANSRTRNWPRPRLEICGNDLWWLRRQNTSRD